MHVLIFAALILLTACLSACASAHRDSVQTPGLEAVPFPLEAQRTASGDQDPLLILSGDKFWNAASSAVSDAVSGTGTLVAGAGDISWAIYRFDSVNSATLSLDIDLDGEPSTDLPEQIYIAIADYGTQRWHWLPVAEVTELITLPIPENIDTLSPFGNTYVAIVAWNDEFLTIESVNLLTEVPRVEWLHTWGTGEMEHLTGGAIDPDCNVYVSGWMNVPETGSFIYSFDSLGNLRWTRETEDLLKVWSVAYSATDDCLYAGSLPAGDSGYVIQKLDSSGNQLWSRRYSVGLDALGEPRLAACPDGGVYAVAWSRILRLDGDGDIVWCKDWNVVDGHLRTQQFIAADATGPYVSGTLDETPGNGGDKLLLRKLNADGTADWHKGWDSDGDTSGGPTVLQEPDKLVLGGHSGSDGLMLQYTRSGTLLRQMRTPGLQGTAIGCTSDGGIYRIGSEFVAPPIYDVSKLKLNPDWELESAHTFSTPMNSGWLFIDPSDAAVFLGAAPRAVDDEGAPFGVWEPREDITTEVTNGVQPVPDMTLEDFSLDVTDWPCNWTNAVGVLDLGAGENDILVMRTS